MNINEQLRELGTMGGLAYAPNDDLVASLLGKTKRVRAARQGAATVVGTVGALALGIAAAQAYSAAKDDPAFRDRNGINDKSGLTPIELYRAKFGNDNPTRAYGTGVDLTSIIDKLKASAASGGGKPGGTQSAPPPVVVKPTSPSKTAPATTPPADPYVQCRADHPEKAYKYYDCPTGQWIVKSGWYKDPADSSYYQCSAQPAYVGYTYDCSTGGYVPKDGYFAFGNGSIYKTITWVDAATGVSSLGNWSGSNNPGGWDYKAILVDSGSKWYREYVYMGGNATWSGSTCTGVTTTLWGTTVKASCLPDWKVDSTGLIHKNYDGIAWIVVDQNLRWNACFGEFDDPANPPAGWMWDGSQWVETPPPSP